MSKEQLQVLVERTSGDADLQAKFKSVSSNDEFNALAAELGIDTSADDLVALLKDSELTEGELAGVSGGVDDTASIFSQIGGAVGYAIGGTIDVITNPGSW
jgi:predicted ribosomally synthesized peptide with nif11-like leader